MAAATEEIKLKLKNKTLNNNFICFPFQDDMIPRTASPQLSTSVSSADARLDYTPMLYQTLPPRAPPRSVTSPRATSIKTVPRTAQKKASETDGFHAPHRDREIVGTHVPERFFSEADALSSGLECHRGPRSNQTNDTNLCQYGADGSSVFSKSEHEPASGSIARGKSKDEASVRERPVESKLAFSTKGGFYAPRRLPPDPPTRKYLNSAATREQGDPEKFRSISVRSNTQNDAYALSSGSEGNLTEDDDKFSSDCDRDINNRSKKSINSDSRSIKSSLVNRY